MILPPLVGVLGFVFILGRAGTVNILLMDWFGLEAPVNFMYGMHGVLLVETVHLFPLMTLSHPGRARQGRPVAGGGGAGRRRHGLAPVLDHHPAAHHAGLYLGRAAGVHLDLRRFHHAAGRRRAGPARAAGLSQHHAVRRPAHFPHGHRDLGAAGRARHPVRDRRARVRGDQGLQLARLFQGRAPPPGAGQALARRGPAHAAHGRVRHPAGGRAVRRGRARLGAHAVPGPLHAGILPRGEHRDAEVHHQLVPVRGARPGPVPGHRGADGLDHDADAGAGAQHHGRAHHADPRDSGNRHRHRLYPRLQRSAAFHRRPADRDVDHPAAGARGAPAALYGARQLFLAAAGAPVDGGSRRQRRRDQTAHLPRHHRAAGVEGHPGRRAVLLHHVDPGSVGHDLSHAGRLGDDSVRHLHLLHRRLAQPGGRARRDPDRGLRAEPATWSTASPGRASVACSADAARPAARTGPCRPSPCSSC